MSFKSIIIFISVVYFSIFAGLNAALSEPHVTPCSFMGYQKAEQDLSEELYQLYRITERLSRANKLDAYSWKIVIKEKEDYDFNTYKDSINTIIIERNTLEIFYGDIHALAYIIAHQMAHQTQGNIVNVSRIQQQLQQKIEVSLQEQENIEEVKDLTEKYIMNGMPNRDGLLAFFLGSMSNRKIKKTLATLQNKEHKLYKEISKDKMNFAKFVEEAEHVADKTAVYYMAQAGFSPHSAIERFRFIYRMPTAKLVKAIETPLESRLARLGAMLPALDTASLAEQGERHLGTSPLLSYKLQPKEQSLRVNSKFATTNKPFDSMFKETQRDIHPCVIKEML